MVAKQLGIPEEKVFNTIQKFGNTTAATIPIGFDEAVKAGKLETRNARGNGCVRKRLHLGFGRFSLVIKNYE